MIKKWFFIIISHLAGMVLYAQNIPKDSSVAKLDSSLIDTTLDYDLFFDELAAFIDSISMPRSYTMGALVLQRGFFNYKNKEDIYLETVKKLTLTPTIGYYHKSGFGITGMASFVNDQKTFRFYQFSISPSYDYLANRDFATGISYTRYLTKDSLPFYTSPLQNELYSYFVYRKWWIKPMVGISYGWGSRSEYNEREDYISSLQLVNTGYTRINTKESVNDFSLITSVRHDFYWLNVLGDKDHIRLTPQLTFTSGSQKFGFNQSSDTYATLIRSGANVLYSTENVSLDNKLYFQPISLAFHVRTEYAIGRFYVQPQLTLDYYFPAEEKQFTSLFSLSAGFMF